MTEEEADNHAEDLLGEEATTVAKEHAKHSSANGEPVSVVVQHNRLRAASVFDIIRREGDKELIRTFHALFWSGLAAGLSIGFSVVSEGILAAHLPDAPWKPLVDNLGYSVGFLIVILGRQQLFTENTLTAVLPAIQRGKLEWWYVLLRLWLIVLTANVIGCAIFAGFISSTGVLSPDVHAAVTHLSEHMMQKPPSEMFLSGIMAGWLIAALVWMLPSSEGNEFIVITLMTYLIAAGDFTHVIAGSVEALFLVFEGRLDLASATFSFFLPTLLGNVTGGTVLFSVIAYAQVRDEI
ncbi:MAG: formate/nitrite transporter family protein [Alphaproteobacteria bacterium]|nr:formate/nitrite transporter family protein [Alphaproteobacteria bacterium]